MKLAAMWAGGAVVSFSAFCGGMALAWPTNPPHTAGQPRTAGGAHRLPDPPGRARR